MEMLIYGIVFFILLVVSFVIFSIGFFLIVKALKLIKNTINDFKKG